MLEAKGDGEPVEAGAGEARTYRRRATAVPQDRKLPVVIVLHQPQSVPGHIGHWLRDNGYPLDIRRPRYGDPLPCTLENHAGAVIFGGPMSANDPDDYIKLETDWISVALDEGKPYLGVCLGAQMMARLLGARVDVHPERHAEIGYYAIRPTAEGERLGAWPRRVYQWHREGFELPKGAVSLATADGPFEQQAFRFGEAAFGIQFHPEITHVQVNRWTSFAHERLTLPHARPREEHIDGHLAHGPAVRTWLDGFLSRWVRLGAAAA